MPDGKEPTVTIKKGSKGTGAKWTQSMLQRIGYRIAVDGDYDSIIYGIYDNRILDSRLLEDDKIQFYGESCGIVSYQSTLGAAISIPSMLIYKIVIK